MDSSIFLAKLFGYVFVLMALHVFFCKKHFRAFADHVVNNPGTANLMSLFSMIMGVLLLLYHNVWVTNWTVVVTIVCWIILLRGLYGFFCPEGAAKTARRVIDSNGLYIVAIINGIIGIFFLIMAYGY